MHFVNAKSILSAKNGMNLYRGCSHGCIYCDSRSKCYHIDHAFEDIEVKANAIELLEDALRRKRSKCMLGTGSMTDPYIPLEKEIGNVRKALSLADQYGFGFTLITKSDRVLRDLDLLKAINDKTKCVVQMTLTTCDEDLCKKIEPNVSTTRERAAVLQKLRDAGIPTVVWLSPILPFINDTEENIRGILEYCIEAQVYGVICFGMGLTLREGNREYFYSQLDRLFPHLKEKYIRTYGMQYQISSPRNDMLMKIFHQLCENNGIVHDNNRIFEYLCSFEEKSSYGTGVRTKNWTTIEL
ncbi:MAG: radical SAM protein [Eubacterium sp.]|nr:radical SAM protein [Eubacterium sp.]